jgi:hypothetical protein
MGEHKREKIVGALHDALAGAATDQGKLIELGWQILAAMVFNQDTPELEKSEMRNAFFCGAQHLYSSVMAVIDEDREPTAQDMRRMQAIHTELEAFRLELSSSHKPGRG